MNNNFFEYAKLAQRIIIVVLTVALLSVMKVVSLEIKEMRTELSKARISIDAMKTETQRLSDEINKGIKIKLW